MINMNHQVSLHWGCKRLSVLQYIIILHVSPVRAFSGTHVSPSLPPPVMSSLMSSISLRCLGADIPLNNIWMWNLEYHSLNIWLIVFWSLGNCKCGNIIHLKTFLSKEPLPYYRLWAFSLTLRTIHHQQKDWRKYDHRKDREKPFNVHVENIPESVPVQVNNKKNFWYYTWILSP